MHTNGIHFREFEIFQSEASQHRQRGEGRQSSISRPASSRAGRQWCSKTIEALAQLQMIPQTRPLEGELEDCKEGSFYIHASTLKQVCVMIYP